jgi:ParB family transcriptional regulator, chromosome partitioning protein
MKATEQKEKNIDTLPSLLLSKLKPFSKHPFKPYNEEKMLELAESINEQGIIVPILVRPIEDKKYSHEIIAGHNRVKAVQLAGLKKIPCDVRELDDAQAVILMVDSNLQRETILPSEKAYAYKYKLDAIKSQGKRTDLTSYQFGTKLKGIRSTDIMAAQFGDSKIQISRYIRLTNLISALLDKVDDRKLAFIPAVELSYLTKNEQEWLHTILNREEHFGVPLAIATRLKGISKNGTLTFEKIDNIIVAKNQEPPKAVKISYRALENYFPKGTTPQEYEKVIKQALEEWFENHSSSTKKIRTDLLDR